MNQSVQFNTPTPKPWLMSLLEPVNELLFLKGFPIIRDIPVLNKIPGIRGLAKVRHIDFPRNDQQQLKSLTGKNRAAFFLPNHPEFFTDWMIDKYVLSKIAPKAACWATGRIVNGMGSLMQRFWLNNNLIAQVPGETLKGKQYSVKAALAGEGVLLHPEGQVRWFGNSISPLYCGAGEMAIDAYHKAITDNVGFESWLAPIIWKLRFNHDVKLKLLDECDYIEKCLGLPASLSHCPARRTYEIYHQLALRDYRLIVDNNDSVADLHLIELRDMIINAVSKQLCEKFSPEKTNQSTIVHSVKKWLQEVNRDHGAYAITKQFCTVHKRWKILCDSAFIHSTISQEEIAEHLKRIRANFCHGSFRDRVNQIIPQAVGNRTAHIRAVKPVAVHEMMANDVNIDSAQIMSKVQQSMQIKLNDLNVELERKSPSLKVHNPFYFISN